MRFSLRTLLIVMLLGGPLCAWGWSAYQAEMTRLELERSKRIEQQKLQYEIDSKEFYRRGEPHEFR